MGITKSTYESILKEYEEIRRAHNHELELRLEEIDKKVPEISKINSKITSLYVKRTMLRLRPDSGTDEESLICETEALKERRKELLAAAGYKETDLSPACSCPVCKDTGYDDEGHMCSCFRSRVIEKLYDFSHIRTVLKAENFSAWSYRFYDDTTAINSKGQTALDIAKEAVSKARAFIDNFDTVPGNLFLCGGTGVGKTFLSNCIAKETIENGHSVVYLSAIKFFEILADFAFNRQNNADTFPAKLIEECDLLIIDDLGTELVNSFVQTKLFNCINERILKNKHTVISANLSAEELQSKYSERVFSRVVSNYTIIKLYAKDIRIQKALEV